MHNDPVRRSSTAEKEKRTDYMRLYSSRFLPSLQALQGVLDFVSTFNPIKKRSAVFETRMSFFRKWHSVVLSNYGKTLALRE